MTDVLQPDLTELSHWRVVTDAEIERIHAGALRILDRVGFRILSRPILERLEARGLRVDYATHSVRATPAQMARVEETARSHASPVPESVLRRPLPTRQRVGHNYTCYYDWTEGERRPATLQDVRNVVRAWHMLPEVTETGPCMTAQEVSPAIEPIRSTVEVMRLTDKIRHCPEMMLAEQLPYLEELETILKGEQVRYHTNGCSVNHFTLDERAADCLLAVARNGLTHWWVNSCPVVGASAPVTLAGAAVMGMAETLGGWLAGWALNEDVELSAIPLTGVMDMATARVLFSTPETILVDAAMYQCFYRLYGIRIGLCIGYTDAKTPGMQAINDKLLKSLAYGLFTDALGGQTGTLDAGNVYSPTQQVIDLELNRQTAHLARGMDVTDVTLALDEIEAFAGEPQSSFLSTDHTLTHWREVLWHPKFMDRTAFAPAEEERGRELYMLERAERHWREALARYCPPDLDAGKIRAAEAVLARATDALR
ncbi:MAG: trimethylamine methyltransferase family protein [Anaerolineae bacterium]